MCIAICYVHVQDCQELLPLICHLLYKLNLIIFQHKMFTCVLCSCICGLVAVYVNHVKSHRKIPNFHFPCPFVNCIVLSYNLRVYGTQYKKGMFLLVEVTDGRITTGTIQLILVKDGKHVFFNVSNHLAEVMQTRVYIH